jgi:zinc/manganese transport system substrate-binding protein
MVHDGRPLWSIVKFHRIPAITALVAIVVALGSMATACGSSSSAGTDKPRVIATTTILGDLVRQVAGDSVDVEVLMPPGADPHEFEASVAQAARIRSADLVVANGLGLEERLEGTLDAASGDGVTVYEVGPELDPQPMEEESEVHLETSGADEADDHGQFDPHVWLDPDRMAMAAGLVAAQLAAATGLDAAPFEERASAYAAKAVAAGREADAILAAVPADQRLLVTNHDALGYFARRFNLTILGTVIPGGSTLAEPSATDISTLADALQATDVKAVFSENTVSPRLIEAVATEVGRNIVVVELFTDSLGEPGSGADTYAGLITTDAALVANGLLGR